MTITPRDYSAITGQLADDYDKMIENHPDAFTVILFKAVHADPETTAEETDVVGSIEADDRMLDYADPITTKALMLPDEGPILVTDEGDEPADVFEQPIAMLILERDVPRQSVVQWDEFVNDTDVRRVSFYVLKSEGIGRIPSATQKHYLLPFDDMFDMPEDEPEEPEEPEAPEEPEEGGEVEP